MRLASRINLSRLATQVLVIGVSGAVLGLVVNGLSHRGLRVTTPFYAAAESGQTACVEPGTELPRIAAAAAAGLCNDCTVAFVDARSASAYSRGHVAGALHLLPAGHADEAAVLGDLDQKRTVVVYDDNPNCKLADSVAHRLKKSGIVDVRILEGGWTAWQELGQPGASGACSACAEGLGH